MTKYKRNHIIYTLSAMHGNRIVKRYVQKVTSIGYHTIGRSGRSLVKHEEVCLSIEQAISKLKYHLQEKINKLKKDLEAIKKQMESLSDTKIIDEASSVMPQEWED